MSEAEKRELQELISLLYGNNISQYGKRCLVQYIEKLQKENQELKEENQRIKDINVELNTDVSAWKTTVEELRKELKE